MDEISGLHLFWYNQVIWVFHKLYKNANIGISVHMWKTLLQVLLS